jgi:hypothetical protein
MLDISIKELRKVMTSSKKAADFIRKHIIVVEKVDGTKLTLIRNNEKFDPNDYTKNWLVAYKGNVIYPTEFEGLTGCEKEIKSSALGTSQYKFVHDHLRKVHPGTVSIPKGTEFFVEFVQNKPTVTRDYAKKHGMFLVGFGPSNFADVGGQLLSTGTFIDDPGKLEAYRETLQLGAFPVVFEGSLSSREAIYEGITESHDYDPKLKEAFDEALSATDFSDPLSIVGAANEAFSRLQSTLGGQAEGVVIKVGGDEISQQQLYKILAADQHSKEARASKQQRYRGSPEEETMYWNDINSVVDELLDEVPRGEPEEMLHQLSRSIYAMKEVSASHPVKTNLNKQEDVLLTAKLRLLGTGSHRAKKIALVPMAAKPYHTGHDALIRAAINDGNDSVIVLVSTGGREKINFSDMVPLWRDIYVPGIRSAYGERVIIRFTDSPTREAVQLAGDMVRRNDATVSIYGDQDDARDRAEQVTKKDPSFQGRVNPMGVPRSETGGVSGTAMRDYLSKGQRKQFESGLPDWMPEDKRDVVWNTLY